MTDQVTAHVSPEVWRTLDANINRASEGLRLLEDVVRFTLNDPGLCRQLRSIRHHLSQASAPWQSELLSSRDSKGDIGRGEDFEEDPKRRDILALVRSNSKRVQEALRTLEELAKLPGVGGIFDWAKLKELRFSAYELEKNVVFLLGSSRSLRGEQAAPRAQKRRSAAEKGPKESHR